MLSPEDKVLIERYLQKNLRENALASFLERMETDADFFEEVLAQQAIQEASLGAHYQKTVQSLRKNEEKEWTDFKRILEQTSLSPSNEPKKEKIPTYSLEELLEEFRVVPAYEKMMMMVERGGSLVVLQPSNKITCKDRKLTFVLQKPTTTNFILRIENNQKHKLLSQPIPSNVTTFTIDLPKNMFTAGLYYWKLMNLEEMVMGSFLIKSK